MQEKPILELTKQEKLILKEIKKRIKETLKNLEK